MDTTTEEIKFPDQTCRMVLMGKTGNGKSSTGNTILNLTGDNPSKVFKTARRLSSSTKECQWLCSNRFGVRLEVVDTPGFFDTDENEAAINREISRCIGMVSPGPHVLLLVIRLDVKFTEEEFASMQQMKGLFGDEMMRHLIIVFTHGDWLEFETIADDYLADCPDCLKEILKECDNRYVVFNNLEKNQERRDEQVWQLLLKIRAMMHSMGDLPFSNSLLERFEATVSRNAVEMGLFEKCTRSMIYHPSSSQLPCTMDTGTKNMQRDMLQAGLKSPEWLLDFMMKMLKAQDGIRLDAEATKHLLDTTLQQVESCRQQFENELTEERGRRLKAEEEVAELKKRIDDLERDNGGLKLEKETFSGEVKQTVEAKKSKKKSRCQII